MVNHFTKPSRVTCKVHLHEDSPTARHASAVQESFFVVIRELFAL